MRIIIAVLLSSCLGACASVPLETVFNLWNFDPWASDFRTWKAALRVPERRGVTFDALNFRMTIETWHEGQSERQKERLAFKLDQDGVDRTWLQAQVRPGYALRVYRLDPKDYERLAALRGRIVASRQGGGPKIQGSLHISASACGRDAAFIDGEPFPISTYLMVDPKDGFNPLLTDYDLAHEVRNAHAKGDGSVTDC